MVRVYAFAEDARYARQIAGAIRSRLSLIQCHRFPDGESMVRVASPASRAAILVRRLDHPDAKIVTTLLAADALRRAGARRVTLVAPYLPYMRQDKVFLPGEPLSQRVIGECLGRSFDRVLTLEPHLHRIRNLADAIPTRAISVSAAPAIARWIGRAGRGCLIAGPDEESGRLAAEVAQAVGARSVVGTKRRLGDRTVRVRFPSIPGASRAMIVDDIASSGATLAAAVRALKSEGIGIVDVIVVHAIFAPSAIRRIRAAGARRIVSCDTIAHPTNAIRTAPLFAAALKGAS
jgi:ribose-phosphate pyrophosphokinase